SGFEFVAVRSTAPAWADGLFRSSAHVSTKKLKVDTSVLCAYRRFKMGWLAAYSGRRFKSHLSRHDGPGGIVSVVFVHPWCHAFPFVERSACAGHIDVGRGSQHGSDGGSIAA